MLSANPIATTVGKQLDRPVRVSFGCVALAIRCASCLPFNALLPVEGASIECAVESLLHKPRAHVRPSRRLSIGRAMSSRHAFVSSATPARRAEVSPRLAICLRCAFRLVQLHLVPPCLRMHRIIHKTNLLLIPNTHGGTRGSRTHLMGPSRREPRQVAVQLRGVSCPSFRLSTQTIQARPAQARCCS